MQKYESLGELPHNNGCSAWIPPAPSDLGDVSGDLEDASSMSLLRKSFTDFLKTMMILIQEYDVGKQNANYKNR